MPDYRELYGGGFKFTVVPIGFRQMWFLRKWPYFSPKKIDLVLYAKPILKYVKDTQVLKVNWELSKVGDTSFKKDGTCILTRESSYQHLGAQINLPFLVGKGNEYALKIKTTQIFTEDWEEIFTFELHGNDDFFIQLVIPALSAVAGAGIILLAQWIFDLMRVK